MIYTAGKLSVLLPVGVHRQPDGRHYGVGLGNGTRTFVTHGNRDKKAGENADYDGAAEYDHEPEGTAGQ